MSKKNLVQNPFCYKASMRTHMSMTVRVSTKTNMCTINFSFFCSSRYQIFFQAAVFTSEQLAFLVKYQFEMSDKAADYSGRQMSKITHQCTTMISLNFFLSKLYLFVPFFLRDFMRIHMYLTKFDLTKFDSTKRTFTVCIHRR